MKLNVKQENAIKDFLTGQTHDHILDIVREINGWDGQLEHLTWYDMDEFNELTNGMEPWDIARAVFFGEFNPTYDYWRFNAYGNLESTDYLSYDYSDIEEIIEALYSIPWENFPDDIKELLEDIESEDEDEE